MFQNVYLFALIEINLSFKSATIFVRIIAEVVLAREFA